MTLEEFCLCYSRCTSHGWLTMDEAIVLVRWAMVTKGPMVEIGSYMGRSAMLLGQLTEEVPLISSLGTVCPASRRTVPRRLYCVDPWDDYFSSDYTGERIYQQFLVNIHSLHRHDIVPVRKRVEQWDTIPAEFVYCDGDHTPTGTAIQVHKALQCRARVIAIHDVTDSPAGKEITRTATELLGQWTEHQGRLAIWDRR